MFFKRFRTLILVIVVAISSSIFTLQWKDSEKAKIVFSVLDRPEVIEKEVIKYIPKMVIKSDDNFILAVNQEYRDALMKISAIKYDGYDSDEKIEQINKYALDALKVPGTMITE